MREALARCHGGRVTPEQPPPGEHQSNGLAEIIGRHVRDHVRVLKLQLQNRIARNVGEDGPIMPWFMRWAAMSMSRFPNGRDGRTPYQRQRGRKCDVEVIPFGETVLYRLPEVANERHQALEEMWSKGVWHGHARHTPEAIIATETPPPPPPAVRRQPWGQQWDGNRIRAVRGSPTDWKLDATEDPDLDEQEDRGRVGIDPGLESRVGSRTGERRSMYLSKKDFTEHGYTDGCT